MAPSDADIALRPPALHGYRGESDVPPEIPAVPLAVCVARQTGARGGAVAERVAELLGWERYSPDWLEFSAQDPTARATLDDLPPDAAAWAGKRFAELLSGPVGRRPALHPLVRLTLDCAAAGHCVLLGKGSTAIVPPARRLAVFVWAPIGQRVLYMAQRYGLSRPEAERQVAERDAGRREYMLANYGVDPDEPTRYDLSVNSASFGVERTAELVAAAAQARLAALAD